MANLTIIITEAPYGKESAFGLLAAAGALATVHDTSVVFAEAGVLNTLKNQNTTNFIEINKKPLDLPSNESKINDYQEADVQFFVNTEALELRAIDDKDLIKGVEKLSIDQLTDKILASDQVLVV